MPTFYEAAGQALRSKTARAKCRQVADRIAATGRGIAAAEGVADQLHIGRESGTRPRGRPFERVTASADTEWGNEFLPRRRILGRAASASARTGRR